MNQKWAIIEGVVTSGYQVASGFAENSPYPRGTLEMQLPFFKDFGLDLSPFYLGTLNISIRPKELNLKNPEYTFRNVKWSPEHGAEDFSFSRCQIIFNGNKYIALIYYPHPETKINHFQDTSIVEIIAVPIPNIKYGDTVNIEINTEEVSTKKTRHV
jgi:CTP-dependent riboflavin kinase